jgi:hypothetical protein
MGDGFLLHRGIDDDALEVRRSDRLDGDGRVNRCVEHRRRPSERAFGIDRPLALLQRRQPVGKGRRIGQRSVFTGELRRKILMNSIADQRH